MNDGRVIQEQLLKSLTEGIIKDCLRDMVNEYIKDNFANMLFKTFRTDSDNAKMMNSLSDINEAKESKRMNLFDISSSNNNSNALVEYLEDFGKSHINKAEEQSNINKTQQDKKPSSNTKYDVQKIDFSNHKLKNKLKNMLNDYDIQQQELADDIQVSRGTIASIINNRGVSLENAFKISKLLGVSIYDIFEYEEVGND